MTQEQVKEWCLHHACRVCEFNKDGDCTLQATKIIQITEDEKQVSYFSTFIAASGYACFDLQSFTENESDSSDLMDAIRNFCKLETDEKRKAILDKYGNKKESTLYEKFVLETSKLPNSLNSDRFKPAYQVNGSNLI